MCEIISMKLGMYITAPVSISTAYLRKTLLSVCVPQCPIVVDRQRLGRNLTVVTNIQATSIFGIPFDLQSLSLHSGNCVKRIRNKYHTVTHTTRNIDARAEKPHSSADSNESVDQDHTIHRPVAFELQKPCKRVLVITY